MVGKKQCVHRYNFFLFLRETENKVPDMGASDVDTCEERNGDNVKVLDPYDSFVVGIGKMQSLLMIHGVKLR